MNERTILVNRAPVLTLWASVVAERLGFDRDEALSLGKAVAGLTHAGWFDSVEVSYSFDR
jgi:hypothetical protein